MLNCIFISLVLPHFVCLLTHMLMNAHMYLSFNVGVLDSELGKDDI